MPRVNLWLTDEGNQKLRDLANEMLKDGLPVEKAQKAHADKPSLGKVIEWLVEQELRNRKLGVM